jgi:hypothetical protein
MGSKTLVSGASAKRGHIVNAYDRGNQRFGPKSLFEMLV